MKNALACAAGRLAVVTGMMGLVHCGSTGADTDPATGRSEAAQHAVTTDSNAQIVPISDVNGNYDLLVTNRTGYVLTCAPNGVPDLKGVHTMELAAGFDSLTLSHLPAPTSLDDPSVQLLLDPPPGSQPGLVRRDQLAALLCNTNQNTLFEFDLPADAGADGGDAGTDRRLFVNLGDKDENGMQILHNVGCGELLTSMGLNVQSPTTLPLSVIGQFVGVSDRYDINCHAGQAPSGYKPALFATPPTQTVTRAQGMAQVAFTHPENDFVPAGATLVATENDCGSSTNGTFTTFLTIDQNARTVSGIVDPHFPSTSCSATFVLRFPLGGTTYETAPATITLTMGCELNTLTSCGACNDKCATPTNAVAQCNNFTCGFTCTDAFRDCNQTASDGCEAQKGTLQNCSTCGNACPTALANAQVACVTPGPGSWGTCGFTCTSGFGDCDHIAATGCETALDTNQNCGQCGNACTGTATCVNGACVAPVCFPTETDCANSCGGSYPDGCGGTTFCRRFAPGQSCCTHLGGLWRLINGTGRCIWRVPPQ